MSSSKLIRQSGLLAMVGGAIWTTSWILNSLTEDGTRAVLGLSERGWRRALDPAMLFFMAGLVGLYARHKRHSGKLLKAGFIITFVSLVTMLAGNVLEWWVRDFIYARGPEHHRLGSLGWTISGLGFMIQPVGFILLGVATLKAKVLSGWRGVLPLILGLIPVVWILVGVMVMLVSDARSASVIFLSMIFLFGLSWIALGYALWSERADVSVTGRRSR